jgi:Tfp pilus assembly protein PilO
MNKLPKDKRDKLILVGLATAGVVAALYLLVISVQKTALEEYANHTEDVKEKLAKAERWLRMAPGIEARLTSCRQELEAKQANMAPVDKFKWFYNTLDHFRAQHRVKLVDITREPEVGDIGVLPRFPYQAATFGVKLNARYHDFGAFLADFENTFPDMRVQNLEIEREGGGHSMGKEAVQPEHRGPNSENLAITMRIVTLIKPTLAL